MQPRLPVARRAPPTSAARRLKPLRSLARGSIRTNQDPRTTAIAIGNAAIGILQRLQIMDEYTDGHDETAHQLLTHEFAAWRTYLTAHAD